MTSLASRPGAGALARAARPRPQAGTGRLRRLDAVLSLSDFERLARRHLPGPVFGYIAAAAETCAALEDNRQAFAEWGFIPRVLAGVGERSTAQALFGHGFAAPFGIAPMGLSALAAYRGDLVLAAAAAGENVPMIMSASSLIRMEEVAQRNPHAWFQAYLPADPEKILALVDRVAAAGFRTLVVTADTIISGNRENAVRAGFSTPLRPGLRLAWDGARRPRWTLSTFLRTLWRHGMPHFENSQADRGAPILSRTVLRDFGGRDHLSWTHLELVRRRWQGRLVVKGIMAAPDARIARDSGCDGVILSNHGGRQLDSTVSPLRTLPEVAAALERTIPVMIDSGIRRGTDILKALGLGADFVFVGRPFLYAASVGGEAGVRHAIGILKAETRRDMGLLGLNAPCEMGRERMLRLR